MENNYQLVTDSSSDLPREYLDREGILSMPLSFTIEGKRYYSGEMDPVEFYRMMRDGAMPITSQVNVDEALTALEPVLQDGRDVLYIGFSSKMSGTLNSVRIAADELREKYPERRIVIVDSLSVCLGQGILVYFANNLKKAGASIEKAAKWAQDNVQKLGHFITTSDLVHLHHGGRISKATTIIGSLLGFQPILTMHADGMPKVIGAKRGKQNALNSLVEHMAKVIGDTVNQICFIAHTDCEDEARYLQEKVRSTFGVQEFMITQAGPVLGAHTGPGAVALFMLADHR